MITQQEAKDILLIKNVHDSLLLKVVRRFIFDKKGEDIGEVQRIQTPIEAQLLSMILPKMEEFYFKH